VREEPKQKKKALANEPVQQALDSGKTFDSISSPSERDSKYAELAPITPKRPKQGGKRGKLTAQQKWQRWASMLSRPAAARAYYAKHGKEIERIRLHPNEVWANTPVEKEEVPDPFEIYEHAMRVWRAACRRRRKLIAHGSALMAKRGGFKRFMEHCEKHPDIYELADGKLSSVRPAPKQPEEPEEERVTPPKLDGRTGIRLQSSKKTKALTAIDKRMAEERKKISKPKEEEPQVLRHHMGANPWLNR
tara:strand:+ start:247 stop:990 length:744 start_codon:yes stop_codon:yes gene_type:complete